MGPTDLHVIAQSQNFTVTPLDLGVILAYLVITIGVGYWYSQRSGGNEDSEGHFLGGRNFIWPFVGFSLLATNMSGSSFVGFAAAGYSTGVNVYNHEWMATVVLIFAALFIFPIYLRSRVSTMPEFLERRFDRRSRYAFSGFTIIANLFVDAAGALYAGAVVIQTIYPNWPLWQIVLGLAVVAGAYTIVGGLAAVVITDTIQAIVLMLGGAIVFFAAMNAIDGVAAVREAAPDGASSAHPPGQRRGHAVAGHPARRAADRLLLLGDPTRSSCSEPSARGPWTTAAGACCSPAR